MMLLVLGLAVLSVTGCEKEIVESMMDAMEQPEAPTKDDPEAYTVALVQSAIDLYKSHGIEAVVAYHNDPENIDGQWYVFITDENDLFIAHAQSPNLIGTDLKTVESVDGLPAGADIATATEEGNWTNYVWPNPESGQDENKRTWAIRYDGLLFGSGYYEPVASTDTDTDTDTESN